MSQKEIAGVLADYKERNDLAILAERMNIPYSSLARIMNEHDPYDLGVRRLISFIEASDFDFTLLDHIEARLGRVAVRVETDNQACDFQVLSNLAREMGHVMEVVSSALADGWINRKEATACIKELMDLVQVAMQIIQELKMIESRPEASSI